jgi:hypothetical protein
VFVVPADAPNDDPSVGVISFPTANTCVGLGIVAQGSMNSPVYSTVAGDKVASNNA